jgi:hypothetical protein
MSMSKIISNASSSSSDIATSSIDSEFSISSTRSALKRLFELRYRLDFLDSLNLLVISCMKSVIDFNQVSKSRSYKKIMKNFNRVKWITIMKNENNSFLVIKTWILTNALRNRRVLRDRWVYKIKRDERDEILRYKARWVVRDFEQIEKLDYTKIFAFVIKSMSYKVIYVIAVVNDWEMLNRCYCIVSFFIERIDDRSSQTQ